MGYLLAPTNEYPFLLNNITLLCITNKSIIFAVNNKELSEKFNELIPLVRELNEERERAEITESISKVLHESGLANTNQYEIPYRVSDLIVSIVFHVNELCKSDLLATSEENNILEDILRTLNLIILKYPNWEKVQEHEQIRILFQANYTQARNYTRVLRELTRLENNIYTTDTK